MTVDSGAETSQWIDVSATDVLPGVDGLVDTNHHEVLQASEFLTLVDRFPGWDWRRQPSTDLPWTGLRRRSVTCGFIGPPSPLRGIRIPATTASKTGASATHPRADPGERTLVAAREVGAGVALPRPGEPFEPGGNRPVRAVVAWGGARPEGCVRTAAEALAGAGIEAVSDTAAVAQADTVSDDGRRVGQCADDPQTLPAG
ncbi:hypothetical protein ACFWMJ_04305 [Streptomyces hawaiiensis]|uniref:hypothetical protein n=1 Tax=Streptomyces hawaiiensis TaxID=67305 RepID=UPI0036653C46